ELDTSVSKLDFSDKELELTEDTNKLALVVGECLLQDASKSPSKSERRKPRVHDFDNFDPNQHSCLDTTETALIVAKIKTGQLNLYQLTNKSDGLCDMQQLGGNEAFFRNYMVWYKEFVTGPRVTNTEGQTKQSRDKVRQYVENFIKRQKQKIISDLPSLEPSVDQDA
ncbi:hypothetical protein FLONG3_11456, partial [Fusarium longipes]